MTRVIFNPMIIRQGFRNCFGEFPSNFNYTLQSFPSVDIKENETTLKFYVELPGMEKEEVKIILEDATLTISGEKKDDRINSDKLRNIKTERRFGKFERKFHLPEDINPEEVKAKFENGLLEISVSKSVPVKPKERVIEVK